MFVKVNNGVSEKFPYTIGELRKANPNVSFPKTLPDDALNAFDVFRVIEAAPPSIDELKQKRERNKIPAIVNGQWVWGWTVIDKSQEEISADNEEKAMRVRYERNKRLDGTDWTQVADAPVDKAAWATYRQALRDIPQQAGFPVTVDWPVKP